MKLQYPQEATHISLPLHIGHLEVLELLDQVGHVQSSVGRVDLLKVGVDLKRGTHVHLWSSGSSGYIHKVIGVNTSYTLYNTLYSRHTVIPHGLILLISYMSLYNLKSQAIRLTLKASTEGRK